MFVLKKKVLFAVLAGCLAFPIFASSATVVSVEGKVEVLRKGTWQVLAANSNVAEGEIISTGFKSKAVLNYQGSLMQLGPLTRITLEKLAQGTQSDTVQVYVNTGAIKSTVRQTENKRVSYTVRNPVAVASVRGTEFEFQSSGVISCSEGALVTYHGEQFNGITGVPASGTSNAATAADDIAPNSPLGAVVVLPGQNVAFTSTGMGATPAQNAATNASGVLATVNTPVNEGIHTGVSMGSSNLANTESSLGVGSISVKAEFE